MVINGHKDSLNNGNMLMVLGLIHGLRERYPDIGFTLLSDMPAVDRARYGTVSGLTIMPRPWRVEGRGKAAAVVTAAAYLPWALAGAAVEKLSRGRVSWLWGTVGKAYREARVAVDVSGDDLTDAYGPASLLQVLYELLLARCLGCRTALLAQSIGPFRGLIQRLLALAVRRLTDLVTLRDPVSVEAWGKAGRSARGAAFFPTTAADLALLTDWPREDGGNPDGPVVVNVSLYSARAALQARRIRPGSPCVENFCGQWADIVALLHEQSSREIILLPHVFRTDAGDDRFFLRRILSACPPGLPVRLVDRVLTPAEAGNIVAGSSFVVSSRMHLALTALRCGVPYLALAYSHKYSLLDYGGESTPGPVLYLESLDADRFPEAVAGRFGKLWKRRVEARREAARHRDLSRLLAVRNVDLLENLLAHGEPGGFNIWGTA